MPCAPSHLRLPKLAPSFDEITFQVRCDTGTFVIRSEGKDLFGGNCSSGGIYSATIPLRLMNVRDVIWVTAASTSWNIGAWAVS